MKETVFLTLMQTVQMVSKQLCSSYGNIDETNPPAKIEKDNEDAGTDGSQISHSTLTSQANQSRCMPWNLEK